MENAILTTIFLYTMIKEKLSNVCDAKEEYMRGYVKPLVIANNTMAEGVYTASGDSGAKCDSIYMNGVWQAGDYSDWGTGTRGYKQQFGCIGCPANTGSGCGLDTHYPPSGPASSYDVDNGNRKPTWEKKGYGPDDTVTDWAM